MKTKEEREIQTYIAKEVKLMLKEKKKRRAGKAAASAAVLALTAAMLTLILIRAFADEAPELALPEPEYTIVTLPSAAQRPTPALEAEPKPETETEPESRYAPVTPEEFELMARVVHAESNNQCFAGQQAVAEVILNRRAAGNFADTIHGVIYAPGQFAVTPVLATTTPNETNYAAVEAALYGEPVFESMDVVYFARWPECWANLAGVIEDHYFCYQYSWARG